MGAIRAKVSDSAHKHWEMFRFCHGMSQQWYQISSTDPQNAPQAVPASFYTVFIRKMESPIIQSTHGKIYKVLFENIQSTLYIILGHLRRKKNYAANLGMDS